MAQASYRLVLDLSQLQVLIARAHFRLSDPRSVRHLGDAVRKWGAMVQARAVYNVSGYPVYYQGGYFRVQVVTGALKGSIELEWPYGGTLFQARVYVNGAHVSAQTIPGAYSKPRPVSEYAGAIERGHAEIDLKKTMKGKTVPFFGARAQKPRGPFAAGGLKPLEVGETGYGSKWQSEALNNKLAAKGKGPMVFDKRGGKAAFSGSKKGTAYYIAFRKVGNEGWVIPAARPRPFMKAAVEGTMDKGRRMLVNAGVELLTNPNL